MKIISIRSSTFGMQQPGIQRQNEFVCRHFGNGISIRQWFTNHLTGCTLIMSPTSSLFATADGYVFTDIDFNSMKESAEYCTFLCKTENKINCGSVVNNPHSIGDSGSPCFSKLIKVENGQFSPSINSEYITFSLNSMKDSEISIAPKGGHLRFRRGPYSVNMRYCETAPPLLSSGFPLSTATNCSKYFNISTAGQTILVEIIPKNHSAYPHGHVKVLTVSRMASNSFEKDENLKNGVRIKQCLECPEGNLKLVKSAPQQLYFLPREKSVCAIRLSIPASTLKLHTEYLPHNLQHELTLADDDDYRDFIWRGKVDRNGTPLELGFILDDGEECMDLGISKIVNEIMMNCVFPSVSVEEESEVCEHDDVVGQFIKDALLCLVSCPLRVPPISTLQDVTKISIKTDILECFKPCVEASAFYSGQVLNPRVIELVPELSLYLKSINIPFLPHGKGVLYVNDNQRMTETEKIWVGGIETKDSNAFSSSLPLATGIGCSGRLSSVGIARRSVLDTQNNEGGLPHIETKML